MMTAGGVTPSSSSEASAPSISTSASLTILTTCCPGVTERSTFWPTAFSVAFSTKSRATGSATSASSSATRTSRIAARTSASVSAPRPRRRSKTPPSRSLRLSNIEILPYTATKRKSAGGRNLAGQRASLDARPMRPVTERGWPPTGMQPRMQDRVVERNCRAGASPYSPGRAEAQPELLPFRENQLMQCRSTSRTHATPCPEPTPP